jgi:hypothetical protein
MKDKTVDGLKITNQFRSRTGFVYDLQCRGDRLVLGIAPRENASDPGEWCVEARTGAKDPDPVVGWGATKLDALREAGVAWVATARERPLPAFDWDAVAKVLAEVRAV